MTAVVVRTKHGVRRTIRETRPLAKTKAWTLVDIVERAVEV